MYVRLFSALLTYFLISRISLSEKSRICSDLKSFNKQMERITNDYVYISMSSTLGQYLVKIIHEQVHKWFIQVFPLFKA